MSILNKWFLNGIVSYHLIINKIVCPKEHIHSKLSETGCQRTRQNKTRQDKTKKRTRKGSAGPQHNSVLFHAATKVLMKQDKFFLSGENKSRFIDLLSEYLTRAGNDVVQCKSDADTEIVKCALDVSKTGRQFNVVADDTDVALLLLYHWKEEMADVSFTSERSKATFDNKSSLSGVILSQNSNKIDFVHPLSQNWLIFGMPTPNRVTKKSTKF